MIRNSSWWVVRGGSVVVIIHENVSCSAHRLFMAVIFFFFGSDQQWLPGDQAFDLGSEVVVHFMMIWVGRFDFMRLSLIHISEPRD